MAKPAVGVDKCLRVICVREIRGIDLPTASEGICGHYHRRNSFGVTVLAEIGGPSILREIISLALEVNEHLPCAYVCRKPAAALALRSSRIFCGERRSSVSSADCIAVALNSIKC